MLKDKNRLAYLALASVCFFWGTTYFGIKIAVRDLPPLLLSGVRHALAGFIFCFYFIAIKKEKIPPFVDLFKMLLIGAFLVLGANVCVSYAEKIIPSNLTALICSGLPFYILFINWVVGGGDNINKISLIGLFVGLFGMLVIFYESISLLFQTEYLTGIFLIILANFSWASGVITTKKFNFKINSIYASGLQMFMIGMVVTFLALVNGDFEKARYTESGIWAFSYLLIFGSLVGFSSFIYATVHLPTSMVSIYAYINPIVAIVLGYVFLDEKIGIYTFIGMPITLVGVYLVNKGNSKILIK